jgi:hypothetical protein
MLRAGTRIDERELHANRAAAEDPADLPRDLASDAVPEVIIDVWLGEALAAL